MISESRFSWRRAGGARSHFARPRTISLGNMVKKQG
jgi:hypothetical protein